MNAPSSSSEPGFDLSHTIGFQDDKGPVLQIFPPYTDMSAGQDTSAPNALYNLQGPISYWTYGNSPLPEADSYEQVLYAPPPDQVFPTPGEGMNPPEDPTHQDVFPWPYEELSSFGASPLSSSDSIISPLPVSPSISADYCLSMPYQEACASSPALQEYSGLFDAGPGQNHTATLASSSFFTIPLSARSPLSDRSSHSPSPSLWSDRTSHRRSKSRDSSPSNSESDLHQQRRRFPCLILECPRRFTSQYTLKVHMEAHKPKPRASFLCTLGCSERFSRQHDRLRHEVAKHGKVCEFSCDECGRFFSTKKTLGNHKCPVAQGGTRWVSQ